MHLSRI